ncbi:MAG: bifunctional metallophosphatase/5'-nucleotidase [Bacteroidales bacterium]|nr:bifunctional metallophosphatase/5'-nucleotidase [Bacteroidales bacterium]
MKLNRTTFILLIATSMSLFNSCQTTPKTVTLKFIETSDVHGAIFPYDFKNDEPLNTSLAQIYTYVQEQRADQSQSVILLDNGDILQGQPLVYYSNFEKPDTEHICASVMNYMKYDAATIGNHDIEAGHPVYDKIEKEFNFPWMAANAINTQTGNPYFKPYSIFIRNGVKIAVLGLTTPGIPMWLPEKIWSGIDFQDMVMSAKEWVKVIQEKENPDVLIGLFHAGVEATYNGQTPDLDRNENAAQLVAERVPGFDVVFVGHDHNSWNYVVKNSEGNEVLILGTKGSAQTATAASILLTRSSRFAKWQKQITGEVIYSENYEPDQAFMDTFKASMQEVKDYVSMPIGRFTKTITTKESFFGNSAFIDLIQRIQLDLTKADISFVAPLSFNAEIKEGEVYVRDMFNLYKYENLLYTMRLSGQEIKDYLEYSYGNWFNQMKNENDHLIKFSRNAQGELNLSKGKPRLASSFYNFSSAAGINYTVDVSKEVGQRITISSMANGSPFDLAKEYTVAINSYRGNGGGGHLTQGAKIPETEIPSRVITSTQKDLRFYLMKWIENEKVVTPKPIGNWSVIPTSWWEKGKATDEQLLF